MLCTGSVDCVFEEVLLFLFTFFCVNFFCNVNLNLNEPEKCDAQKAAIDEIIQKVRKVLCAKNIEKW